MDELKGFTHLRVHSQHSFLRGLASPRALAEAAAKLGFTSLALTDHHSLSGAVEFYEACQELGLRPILGLELEAAPPVELATAPGGALVFLALDMPGWGNLCGLSSTLTSDTGRIPFETLQQHTEGLICLSGGLRGAAEKLVRASQTRLAEALLQRLSQCFPGRFYVELQCHLPEDEAWLAKMAALAARLELPAVATHDVHYLDPKEADVQRVAAAARLNLTLTELPAEETAPHEAMLHSPGKMAELFSAYPAAFAAAGQIAARCQLSLPLGAPHYPEIELPAGMTALDLLREKAMQGALHIYAQDAQALPAAIQQRLEHELEVIAETGYATLFLIMEDILAFARRQNVLFASRGSAASSLVAHCLGITTPDPIAHNLYFERFLNPARHSPPDIDTDLCSRRREEVIRYVYERFGQERVATVCTVNRMRRRSALRAAAKAYGLPAETISQMVDTLPFRWYSPAQRGREDQAPYDELKAQYRDPLHQEVFKAAEALIGLPSHLSVHPGGMVITPGALTQLVPVTQAAKGVTITQFDLHSIERLGLVKIDLLGIRGLTVLSDAAAAIPSAAASQSLVERLETIPLQDEATSNLLEKGQTIGCFQIESPGMRATLREIHARSEADLLVALALYRPGPLTGGLKDAFVRRHRGLEATEYLHPALQRLLADTYGVILYQEQVLRIANELAGFSLAEADLLRRAMSHFDPGKQMITLQEKFIAGARQRNGVPEEVGQRIWELMAAFAGYGFPKAHAASYAQLGWRLAWCKAHLPAVFMAGVLANWGGYYSQRVYLIEARRLGLKVRPPHVNHARREFSVSYLENEPVLFMGLDQVRDLSHRTQAQIMRQQPFHSLDDFLARADPRPLEAENLAKVGALAGFGTIPGLLRRIAQGGWQGGQLPLFPVAVHQGEEWSLAERVTAQAELLGASLDAHPLELIPERVAASGAISILEAVSRPGERVRVAGIRQTWRRSYLGAGEFIYFLALEDLDGMLDVLIPQAIYLRSRSALDTAGPYLVEGVMEKDPDSGEPLLRAERIARF
jgi:DNA-directed DNA polymerase III PolC